MLFESKKLIDCKNTKEIGSNSINLKSTFIKLDTTQ